jgi:hypothetical protein
MKIIITEQQYKLLRRIIGEESEDDMDDYKEFNIDDWRADKDEKERKEKYDNSGEDVKSVVLMLTTHQNFKYF